MADRPSFLNLDQAQNDLKAIQGKMNSEMSNFENQTIQQTRNAINTIGSEIKNLQSTLSSENILGPLKKEMEQTLDLFSKFKDIGNQAISSQKYEVESFTNNISQMYEAIKKSYDAMQEFNGLKIGDVQQINDFQRSINSLKDSFEDFVSTSDIIDINQADLDSIRQRMMDFMKSLSVEGTKAFNLAEMMTNASQDPALKLALTNMLIPLNEAIAQIPSNVIDSFVKTQNQVSTSGGNNLIQDLIGSLNSFSGIIQSQMPGTGMGVYDPNFANQQNQVRNEANAKASEEAESATLLRLSTHLDKIFSSSSYSSKVDKNMSKLGNNSVDLDSKLDKLMGALGSYSKSDLSMLAKIGMDQNSIGTLRQDSDQIQKLLSSYEMHSNGANKAVSSYKTASNKYESNSSPENLQKLIESEKKVKEEAGLAAEALDELMRYTSKYVNDLDFDTTAFKHLPIEMKDVLMSMNDLFNTNIESGSDLLKLYEAFGINLDNIGDNLKRSMSDTKSSLNDMNNQMSSSGSNGGFLSGIFGEDSKVTKGLGTVTKLLTAAISGFTGYYSMMDKIGLNPGMPTNLNGILSYVKGGSQWIRNFGQMDYQSAMAQTAQGGGINTDLLENYHETSKEIFRMSGGQIKNQEYYDIVNKLLTQVQGQYGGDKSSGMQDMESMSKMALMIEKVYGVDSVSTINTFYKEFGMGTTEVNDLLGRLVENAEMANIPVSQYVKTISELSLKFKDLGVDIKVVESGMRNLTMEGMTFSNAQDLVSGVGNAVNRFTDSGGQMAVWGMLSGQFSNPWDAMWQMSDRWDENGELKPEATQAIINSLGTQMDYTMRMYGGNESATKWGMLETLKNMGISDEKSRGVLVNKFFDGDYDSFGEMLNKYFMEEAEGGSDLERELQTKIEAATEQLDVLTQAEALVIASQQDLADSMENLATIMVGDLSNDLEKLTGALNGFVGKISESDLAQNIAGNMNWLGPLGGGLFSAAGAVVAGKVGGNLVKGGLSKVKGLFSKGTTAAASGAGDVVGAVAKNGDEVLEVVTQSGKVIKGGADEVAAALLKSGDEVAQIVGEGGQLMFKSSDEIATALSKTGQSVSKAIGSSGDDVASALLSSTDEILLGGTKIAGKFAKALPIIGGMLDFGLTFYNSKSSGASTSDAIWDGVGSTAGGVIGGAIGSFLGPWGTVGGAVIGSMLGEKAVGLFRNSNLSEEEASKITADNKSDLFDTGYESGFIDISYTDTPTWVTEEDIVTMLNDKTGAYQWNLESNEFLRNASNAGAKTFEDALLANPNSEAAKQLLNETKEMKFSAQTGYSQYARSSQEQIDLMVQANETSDKTTKSIDDLKDKTDELESSINKKFNEQSDLLKNDGIKIKSMPSMTTWSGRPSSEVTTSDGTTFNRGEFNTFRDEVNSILSNGSSSSSSSNSSSGSTTSRSVVAGRNIDQVLHQNLTQKTDLSADDINDWIADKAGSNSKMLGMGDAFLKASQESGLDPLYLVAHAALETGWGTSSILNNKNNWFGIGAFDSSPYESAYGFSNLEAGIIEGAKWISKNYTNRDSEQQNTLYKMVNAQDGWHNYATDPGWARKIASMMITGAGGEYQAWDGTGYSGSSSDNYYTASTKSWEELVSENTFGSTVFSIGSKEWSNGSQGYNVLDYKDYDFGENSTYLFRDSQAMARNTYLDSQQDLYKSTIEAYDNRSSAYNQNPEFNININVNGEGGNYEAMANEMKTALSNIALQYMGSSARIASANYERANSQY